MVRFRQKGDFSKLTGYFERVKEVVNVGDLNIYGRKGVAALESATPVDSGLTAKCWYYEIEREKDRVRLIFKNSNVIDDWFQIAICLQYGHATGTGGWVEGRDYINPAIQPIFDKLAEEAWKGVTKV